MDRRGPWFTTVMIVVMFSSIGVSTVYAEQGKSALANWHTLRGLTPGDDIRIVLNDRKSYRAKFQSVSEESIVVRLATGDQAYERQSVFRVSAKGTSHRTRNTLIGAGIGLGGGLAIGAGAHRVSTSNGYPYNHYMEAGAIGGAVAGGIGAGIGALASKGEWNDVYRAR